MKNKRTVIVMLVTFLAVISIMFVGRTYAKYISSASADGTVDAAKWTIKVNTIDITGAGTTALGDVALTTVDSVHTLGGKIAPSNSAYATFTIDPEGTEVSVGYYFSLGTISAGKCSVTTAKTETACTTASGTWTAATLPTGLAVSSVKYCTGTTCVADESAGTWTAITKTDDLYKGSINLTNDTKKGTAALASTDKVMVKVLVTWTDDETAGATVEDAVDDVAHTATGVVAPSLTIPVTATVYQKIS